MKRSTFQPLRSGRAAIARDRFSPALSPGARSASAGEALAGIGFVWLAANASFGSPAFAARSPAYYPRLMTAAAS